MVFKAISNNMKELYFCICVPVPISVGIDLRFFGRVISEARAGVPRHDVIVLERDSSVIEILAAHHRRYKRDLLQARCFQS